MTGNIWRNQHCGALPCKHWWIITPSLCWLCWGMTNQYNSEWSMRVKPRQLRPLHSTHAWSLAAIVFGHSSSNALQWLIWDVSKPWTSAFAFSVSSNCRTLHHWWSPWKHVRIITAAGLSRLRSNQTVTPRRCTWSLAVMISFLSCIDGPLRPIWVEP